MDHKPTRLRQLRQHLAALHRLGQSAPMNLAEQLHHAHRLRRTVAAMAKCEQESKHLWAWRRARLKRAKARHENKDALVNEFR